MPESLSLAHSLWRKLPVSARRMALQKVAAYLAPVADANPPRISQGVVVGGELDQPTGLGAAARALEVGAKAIGFYCGNVRLGVGRPIKEAVPERAALLLAINAPSLSLMLARAGKDWLRGRRLIGSWAWELPVVPPDWQHGRKYVHEVWAPSPFVAKALESVLHEPVRMVPYPLALCPLSEGTLPDVLALPENAVVVLMVLSLGSSFARKNPLAGIAAFYQAFGSQPDYCLVVKLHGAAAYPREAALLQAQAGPNIKVVSAVWTQEAMDGLMARADIVLSLHRSEGFGLVLAEAMLRGKPVVATGWSGNMGFMDEACAGLIDYRLVAVEDSGGVYRAMQGAVWAEPDIGHAAIWLRHLGNDAAARAEMGRLAQNHARYCLSGDVMKAALQANGIEGCLPENVAM